jgi:hypothetical protein
MLTDALLAFVPIGSPLSLVGGAGVALPSAVIDLLGAGVGVAPPNIIGNATLFGTDAGIGLVRPQLNCVIGTAPTTSNAATLNLAFQAAPDTAGTHQPGTWQTLVETGYMTIAQLAANTVFARFDFPPAFPANLNPRYLRLLAQPLTATNFTAGTISSALVVMARDDQSNKYQAANYVVV